MEEMTKPAFGMPPISYETKPVDEDSDFEDDAQKRSKFLWGFVTKNLLDPLTEGESEPYLLKVHHERLNMKKRIFMQEFATAHNLKL